VLFGHYFVAVDPKFFEPGAPMTIGRVCSGPLLKPEIRPCPHNNHVNLHTAVLKKETHIIGRGRLVGMTGRLALNNQCFLCLTASFKIDNNSRRRSNHATCEAKGCDAKKPDSKTRYCVKHVMESIKNRKITTDQRHLNDDECFNVGAPASWKPGTTLVELFQHHIPQVDVDKIGGGSLEHLSSVLRALENEDSVKPRVRFPDTEFMKKQLQEPRVTELAITNYQNDLLANWFLTYEDKNEPLSSVRAHKPSLPIPSYIRASKAPLKLLDVVRPTDFIAEWSTNKCDIVNIIRLFEKSEPPSGYELPNGYTPAVGYEPPHVVGNTDKVVEERKIWGRKLWPQKSQAFSVCVLTQRMLSKIGVILPDHRLQTVFHFFLQAHELVFFHHLAMVDAFKCVQVMKVLVELFKPPGKRNFPPGFGKEMGHFVLNHMEKNSKSSKKLLLGREKRQKLNPASRRGPMDEFMVRDKQPQDLATALLHTKIATNIREETISGEDLDTIGNGLEIEPSTNTTRHRRSQPIRQNTRKRPAPMNDPGTESEDQNTEEEEYESDSEDAYEPESEDEHEIVQDVEDECDDHRDEKHIPNIGELIDRENGERERDQEEIEEIEDEADQGDGDEKDSQLSLEQHVKITRRNNAKPQNASFAIHCEHCDLPFKDLNALERHVIRWGSTKKWGGLCAFHLDPRVYPCAYCGDKFTTVAYKDKHEREVCRHRADESFDEAVTEDSEPVVLEELVHVYDGVKYAFVLTQGGERIECLHRGCNTPLKNTQDSLRSHIQRCHLISRDWICEEPECGKTFNTKAIRNQHYKLTHLTKPYGRERLYVCTHEGCGRAYNLLGSLTSHERTHTGESQYKCEYPNCSEFFTQAEKLAIHTRNHTSEEPFKCEFEDCGRTFKQKSNLTSHGLDHLSPTIACPHDGCDELFTTNKKLKRHLGKHGDAKAKNFQCLIPNCFSKGFKEKSDLNFHMKKFHSPQTVEDKKPANTKAVQCPDPYCHSKGFGRPAELNKHMRGVHPTWSIDDNKRWNPPDNSTD